METDRLLEEEITELSSESDPPMPHCSHDVAPSGYEELPGLVVTYNQSINTDDVREPCCAQSQDTVITNTYKVRWYILTMFTMFSFMQGELTISWTVIAQSVEAAFGWTDSTLSLMQDWLYITYLLAIVPFAWLMEKKG